MNWNNIQATPFTVTVTATDTHGKSTRAIITWTVSDTTRLMPNYIGAEGCAGCEGLPDISAISHQQNTCAYVPNSDSNHIWRQSTSPPGTVITWGRTSPTGTAGRSPPAITYLRVRRKPP